MFKKQIVIQALNEARRLTRGDRREITMLLVTPMVQLTAAVLGIQLVARGLGVATEGTEVSVAAFAAAMVVAVMARPKIEAFAARFHGRLDAEDAQRLKVSTAGIEVREIVEAAPAQDRLAVATDGLESHDATEAEVVAEYQSAVDRGDLVAAACLEAVIDLAEYRKRKDAALEVQDADG